MGCAKWSNILIMLLPEMPVYSGVFEILYNMQFEIFNNGNLCLKDMTKRACNNKMHCNCK